MKKTFKFLFYTLFLASLFTFTSCEDNLETSCDDFSATISYEIDTSVNTIAVNLTANPIGGVAPFTYAWSTGDNSQTITVTEEAVYSVTLTDADACTASLDFTVQDTTNTIACINFQVELDVNESGSSTFITANASGGTEPYTYLWNTGQVTQLITATTPGLYGVTVTDDIGCTVFANTVISQDSCYLQVSINVDDTGVDPILTASVGGGTGPYKYVWNSGEITESIVADYPGFREVTVTDVDGCIGLASYVVMDDSTGCDNFYGQIVIDYNPIGADMLTAEVNGGTEPYTYSWNTGEITQSIQPNSPGTYLVDVVDADGCSLTMTSVYEPANCADFEIDLVAIPDSSSSLMILYVETLNGSPNLTDYLWSTGENVSSIFVAPQGTFSVTVTNDQGCVDDDEITL